MVLDWRCRGLFYTTTERGAPLRGELASYLSLKNSGECHPVGFRHRLETSLLDHHGAWDRETARRLARARATNRQTNILYAHLSATDRCLSMPKAVYTSAGPWEQKTSFVFYISAFSMAV